jgi:methionyl aminopeptidase
MIKLKNKEQIEGIRKSGALLARLFQNIQDRIKPGISLISLDQWAYDFILAGGGQPAFKGYMGFPATLCTSLNHAVIHGIPDRTKLQEGDLISVDCGINLGGYISDMAYTFPVGRISEENEKLLKITNEALYKGIGAVQKGKRIKDISKAISDHITPGGYGIVHQYCGHGVGLEVHEEPQVPNYLGPGPNPRLKPGMVIAIEPMVNLGVAEVDVLEDDWTVVTRDGKRSAHFEHTVAVTENGIEILTQGFN